MAEKNFDLIWAREHAGLTQAAAAAKIGVARETFARWESGAQPTPERKFQRFLEATGVERSSIPAQRKYGRDGYPVGFVKTDTGDFDADFGEDARRLQEVEGDEYTARERVRTEMGERIFGEKYGMPPEVIERNVANELAKFDAETARLAGLVADLI